jgi:hypothetical protein
MNHPVKRLNGFETYKWYVADDYDLELQLGSSLTVFNLEKRKLGLVIETTITTELVFDTYFDGNIYTPRGEPVVRFMLISMI